MAGDLGVRKGFEALGLPATPKELLAASRTLAPVACVRRDAPLARAPVTDATIPLLMDRAAIEELFTFTDYSWREYERVIRPHGDDILTAPAPGSGWPALRDALAHINWAYVRWLADPAGTTDEPVERVESWDELDAYRRSRPRPRPRVLRFARGR